MDSFPYPNWAWGSMRSPCSFLIFHPGEYRITMQRKKERWKLRRKVWDTPAPHSMAWCGVQAKPSWNLCIWGVGIWESSFKEWWFHCQVLPCETSLRLLCWLTPPVFSSTTRLGGCFWVPSVFWGGCRGNIPQIFWISAGFDALRVAALGGEQGFAPRGVFGKDF